MSDPAGIKYDGRFEAPVQQGPTVPIVNNDTKSMLYEQRFWQLASRFTRLPWSSKGPFGSYLVDETAATDKGGGIVEWTRLFAVVPPLRVEFETTVHNYQFILNGQELIEIPSTTRSTITYSYFHTTSSSPVVTLARSFRFVPVGKEIHVLGDPTIGGVGGSVLHEDETFRRWKGNIYEKRSVRVPFFNEHIH